MISLPTKSLLESYISIGKSYSMLMTKFKTTMKIEKATRETLKHIVRRDETYEDLIRQRVRCDAQGCDAPGSIELKISAGKFGDVTLFVCNNCVGKFSE